MAEFRQVKREHVHGISLREPTRIYTALGAALIGALRPWSCTRMYRCSRAGLASSMSCRNPWFSDKKTSPKNAHGRYFSTPKFLHVAWKPAVSYMEIPFQCTGIARQEGDNVVVQAAEARRLYTCDEKGLSQRSDEGSRGIIPFDLRKRASSTAPALRPCPSHTLLSFLPLVL